MGNGSSELRRMSRRAVLGGGIALVSLKSSAAQALPAQGSFRLFDRPQEAPLHVDVYGNSLYCVTLDRNTASQFFRQLDLNGQPKSSYQLPSEARYNYFGVTDPGTFIFPRGVKGSGWDVEERTAQGALVRRFSERAGAQGARSYCVVGKSLLALRGDNSVDSVGLGEGQPSWRRLLGSAGFFRSPCMLNAGSPNALIIDATNGAGLSVDVARGETTPLTLTSAEVQAAQAYYAKAAARYPDGSQRTFIVFGALAVAHGTLHAAILPCDPKVGLNVLTFDLRGRHKSSSVLQFQAGKKAPSHLALAGGNLLLIFPDGEVLRYKPDRMG